MSAIEIIRIGEKDYMEEIIMKNKYVVMRYGKVMEDYFDTKSAAKNYIWNFSIDNNRLTKEDIKELFQIHKADITIKIHLPATNHKAL